MKLDDAVPIVIRNQRVRGPVPWMWLFGWIALGLATGLLAELYVRSEWHWAVDFGLLVVFLASFVVIVIWLDHHPRVKRIKLDDELRVYPGRQHKPADLTAVRFGFDPDEDYVDAAVPVPVCEVTIDAYGRPSVRLIASVVDARRLRLWAEGKGVTVDDPHHLLTDNLTPERGDA
jgi:hypothetical protein